MEYSKFCELLRKGESDKVDFKIECDACTSSAKANAELTKDIIAMANNGYVASYIVVGVSDNAKGFRSVANGSLTDDRLQRLCRDSIHPIPAVKLSSHTWEKGTDAAHRGKTFIVIQVGPQPRQCFRFSRDMIRWGDGYCFRKHEVWIRRGATSDLATPEEVARLVQGRAPIAPPTSPTNVDYTRLPREDQKQAVGRDLVDLIKSAGGKAYSHRHATRGWSRQGWFQAVLPFGGRHLVLMVLVVDACNTKGSIMQHIRTCISVQHGLALVSLGSVSPQATSGLNLALKEPWGWFCALDADRTWTGAARMPQPVLDMYEADRFCAAYHRVNCSDRLARAWQGMLGSLGAIDEIARVAASRRVGLDAALTRWLEDGCPGGTVDRHGRWVRERQPAYEAQVRAYSDFVRSLARGPTAAR